MNLISLLENKQGPTISFEFYAVHDEESFRKLEEVIENLVSLSPDFVTVTFGAGGSTREGSYQLIKKLKLNKKLNVIPYFAGYGLAPDDVRTVLDAYHSLGAKSILCVRGDKPRDLSDFRPHPQSFPHASDLIAFVHGSYDFCIGAAGYPEGHREAETKEKDLEYLKLKVDNGASFIITQYFYDNRFFFEFVERCRNSSINVPIIAGVMPIFSIKMTESLSHLCGATITPQVRDGLRVLPPGDKDAVLRFGIEFAVEQCRALIKWGVQGLHFYTMNRSRSTKEVVDRLQTEQLI